MLVATLVHPRLSVATLDAARDALAAAGARPGAPAWLSRDEAADIHFSGTEVASARAALKPLWTEVDVFVQPAATRLKRMLIADMDSTIITIECIDELADYAGIKPQVAAVTEAAMRGELDFVGALDARVALLKGLPRTVLDRCYTERVRLTSGARTLVRTMAAGGACTVLVSGGFTSIAERVGADAGFGRVVANELGIDEVSQRLDGTVKRPVVTAETKKATLEAEAASRSLVADDVLAVGDGANDIPMIRSAGLGVAFRGKERTEAAAGAVMRHNGLAALLFAQGIPKASWTGS